MKNTLPILLVLASGCIETNISSTVPPAGVPNPKPLVTPTQTDRLVQVQTPEVDILWVIDNSCSMSDEQNALSENFPVFMDFFLGSGLDYHIGVITTDTGDNGQLVGASGYKWIDPVTPNPANVFSAMAVLSTGGSGDERGREQAYAALEIQSDGVNAGFVREDAALHLVFISDEDDHSSNSREEFVNYLTTLKFEPDMLTASSIVSPGSGCDVEEGKDYIYVTNNVGGILWSICNEDWVGLLEQLGIQASGLKREYFLSQLPVPGTIEVWVIENGVTYEFAEEVDWTYDPTRNSIQFIEYVPTALSEVYVEYDVLSANEEI